MKLLGKLQLRAGPAGTLRSGGGRSACRWMPCPVYLLPGLPGEPAHQGLVGFFLRRLPLAVYHRNDSLNSFHLVLVPGCLQTSSRESVGRPERCARRFAGCLGRFPGIKGLQRRARFFCQQFRKTRLLASSAYFGAVQKGFAQRQSCLNNPSALTVPHVPWEFPALSVRKIPSPSSRGRKEEVRLG